MARQPEKRSGSLLQALIIVAFVIYGFRFIFRTSFLIGQTRYFCLFDDAMIGMRYARNLVAGHGLVFNLGERVEAFTNPLWVLIMAVAHLFPISPPKISFVIQVISLGFLVANLFVIRQITREVHPGSRFAVAVALLLTAFYYPLNNWALQGMEVGLFAFLISLIVLRTLQGAERPGGDPVLWVSLVALSMVRPDGVVPAAVVILWGLIYLRGAPRRKMALGLAWLAGSVAAQTLFRLGYYGSFFPNTYYQKLVGFPPLLRITRGLLMAAKTFAWYGFLFPLLAVVYAIETKSRKVILLLSLISVQIAYSIYVGGDAWEDLVDANRFITPVMPLLFILLACWVEQVQEYLQGSGRKAWAQLVVGALALAMLLGFNCRDGDSAMKWLLLSKPLFADENQKMVQRSLLISRIASPQAKVAVVWAGIMPYFLGDHPIVDMLGKADVHVGREPMHLLAHDFRRFFAFYPGHLKYDYAYSFGMLRPDIVTQLWFDRDEAYRYLASDYVLVTFDNELTLSLRKGSPEIAWPEVINSGCQASPESGAAGLPLKPCSEPVAATSER